MTCKPSHIGVTLLLLFSVSLFKNIGMENWLVIKHVQRDGYFVSDLGRIKVIKAGREIVKIGSLRQDGYRIIATGKTTYHLVHKLVLENFTDRPDWAECVNHINGVKDDNRLCNLEWSTIKSNNLHAFRTGLNKTVGAIGVSHPGARDIREVHEIYRLKKEGKRIYEIQKELNLKLHRVTRVYNGIDWKYEYLKFFPCATIVT